MAIKKLSVKLLNQIAAGEVVERPASVVKELLENAIDSKASRIVLKVENSGKTLICVTDNGCGIDKEDLALALEAHATSKIATTEDLACINTLGFRGEALASISSVSKLCLTSKTASGETAHAIYAQGLEKDNTIYPAAHPVGTSVEVCELFFNTPARRRFLKSDKTEFSHIRDIFVKTALANPQVQFEFIHDAKRVLFVKEVENKTKENLSQRIASVLGSQFNDCLYSAANTKALSVEAFILPPPESKADSASDLIYIFLNSRVIADRVLVHAIRQAYITVYNKSCPCRAVLYLHCDPQDVDVNVHPRKDEVRFHEQRLVHDTLLETLAATLQEHENIRLRQQTDLFDDSFNNCNTNLNTALSSTQQTAFNASGFTAADSTHIAHSQGLTSSSNSFNTKAFNAHNKAGADNFKSQSATTIGRDDLAFLNRNNVIDANHDTKVFNLNDFIDSSEQSNHAPSVSSFATNLHNINKAGPFDTEHTIDSAESIAYQGAHTSYNKSYNESINNSKEHISDNKTDTAANSQAQLRVNTQAECELSQGGNAIHASHQISSTKTVAFATNYASGINNKKDLGSIELGSAQPLDARGSVKGLFYYGTVLSQVFFVRYDSSYYLIKIKDFILSYRAYEYTLLFKINNIQSHTLTMPFEFRVQKDLLKQLKLMHFNFERLGFNLVFKTMSVVIRAVPVALKDMTLSKSMVEILELLCDYQSQLVNSNCPFDLAYKMFLSVDNNVSFNERQIVDILQKCSFADFFKLLKPMSYTKVDIGSMAYDLLNNKDS